ncbi:MAG: hypothetical protein IKQ70_00545, partial [Bacteroidales bacterium]|nr:hypothetical protein [Bacteroidales bacterium]
MEKCDDFHILLCFFVNFLSSIIEAYRLDFSKHAPSTDIQKIADIWNSMPSQLSKENRKFQFKLVKS